MVYPILFRAFKTLCRQIGKEKDSTLKLRFVLEIKLKLHFKAQVVYNAHSKEFEVLFL